MHSLAHISSEISQRLKTVLSASYLPSRRKFSHFHFPRFTADLLIFKTSITSTRRLALTSNLDENIDKVSERSHKVISLGIFLPAAPFLPLQTRDQTQLKDAPYIEYPKILQHCCTLLSPQVYLPRLVFTSLAVHVMSPVALENLRNELSFRSGVCSGYSMYKDCDWNCHGAYSTASRSVLAVNDCFVLWLRLPSKFNERRIFKGIPRLNTEPP